MSFIELSTSPTLFTSMYSYSICDMQAYSKLLAVWCRFNCCGSVSNYLPIPFQTDE